LDVVTEAIIGSRSMGVGCCAAGHSWMREGSIGLEGYPWWKTLHLRQKFYDTDLNPSVMPGTRYRSMRTGHRSSASVGGLQVSGATRVRVILNGSNKFGSRAIIPTSEGATRKTNPIVGHEPPVGVRRGPRSRTPDRRLRPSNLSLASRDAARRVQGQRYISVRGKEGERPLCLSETMSGSTDGAGHRGAVSK
jgi:hypothetical protein